jgi:uncharacterized protein (TIGR02594 family)
MISRRKMILGLATYSAVLSASRAAQSETDAAFYELTYPPFGALTEPQEFGYKAATEEQKRIARDIINGTPKGPKPIDLAQSFVDRFYQRDPKVISQWPAPAEWNPLIKEFFDATSTPKNNDMTPWCAAFVNWCLERAGRIGSKSSSSQSFLSRYFKTVQEPQYGDLAIFSCYEKSTEKCLGIGHATFFKEKLPNGRILVVGGNQSKDGHSSIISEAKFMTGDRDVYRTIGGKYVPCTMRLNSYVRVV